MKKISLLFLLFASLFVYCSADNVVAKVHNPFDPSSKLDRVQRNKIVVISDLHLGNDLTYSENVKHLKRLNQFLNEVRTSSTIKELVIAGDMFDEWYIPTRTNTYENKSQSDFILKTVAANKPIFDVLNGIIKGKKIKVTYIPGNHDMGFTPESIDLAMPGVNQARDSKEKYGIGTYYPDNYPEIAIEHGHRNDFFCNITTDGADPDAIGTTFGPGYFFARIAANSFVNPIAIENRTRVPKVVLHDSTNPEQFSKNTYYNLWKDVLDSTIYVNDKFDEKIIVTGIDNFTKTYSINDILPYNDANGNIQMKMYNGMFTQAAWKKRQIANNVKVITLIDSAIIGSKETQFIDDQSNLQYFRRSDRQHVRVVVFGHTHIPKMTAYKNNVGLNCVYANSGTWEDQKTRNKSNVIDQDLMNMNFVVIAPMTANHKKLNIKLYKYLYGKHRVVDSKDVDLSAKPIY